MMCRRGLTANPGRKWSGGDFDIQTIQVRYVSCITWYMAAVSHLISCPFFSESSGYFVCICSDNSFMSSQHLWSLSIWFLLGKSEPVIANSTQNHVLWQVCASLRFWWPNFCSILASWSLNTSSYTESFMKPSSTDYRTLIYPLVHRAFHPYLESFCDPDFCTIERIIHNHTLPLLHNLLFYFLWTLFGSISRVWQVVLDVIRVGPTERRCEAGSQCAKAQDAWKGALGM